VVENKNQAIPAYDLAVSPSPLFAFEGLNVALKGICAHAVNRPLNDPLQIAGKFAELLLGFAGESDYPRHTLQP